MSGIVKPKNRQVKLKGSDDWFSFGNVSIEDAAVAFAQQRNVESDRIYVVVREETENVEEVLTVESFRGFRVASVAG